MHTAQLKCIVEIEAEHGSLAVSAEFLILEWDLLSRHSSRAFLELREICPKLGILVLSWEYLSQAGNTCPKWTLLAPWPQEIWASCATTNGLRCPSDS